MSTTRYDSKGQPVRLGSRIASGGEGEIFPVESRPGTVAKVYLKPVDAARAAKIRYMVSGQTPTLLQLAAWPIETLHASPSGPIVGLLMPRVDRARKVHELYNQQSRKVHFPEANWAFLVHVAANTARAFATVHQHGHVVGDVNHSNLLVNANGTVRLIDCDSFEIVTPAGQRFRCGVAVPDYTPPELFGQDLGAIARTQNHDLFGLAVLIFHLLMLGRHPFAGVYRGGREAMPINRAIPELRYAFGQDAGRLEMARPPGTVEIGILPPATADLFEQAFSLPRPNALVRPTATDWLTQLTGLGRSLRTCSRGKQHQYANHLAACPWCALERTARVIAFPVPPPTSPPSAATGSASQAVPGLDVEAIWRKIESLGPLGGAPPIIVPAVKVSPDPEMAAAKKKAGRRSGWSTVIALVIGVFVLGNFGPWWTAGYAVLALFVVMGTRGTGDLGKLRAAHQPILSAAEREWKAASAAWDAATTDRPYTEKHQQMRSAVEKWRQVAGQKSSAIARINSEHEQRQRQQYLQRQQLRSATISGLGPARIATLEGAGIRTAADATWDRIIALPGFGPSLTSNVMTWKGMVSARFTYNSAAADVAAAINDAQVAYDVERRMLETDVQNLAEQLTKIRAEIEQNRSKKLQETQAVKARYEEAKARMNALT